MLPKTILVPTDLSDGANVALDLACELAAKLDATVHLLNAIAFPTMAVPELGVGMTTSLIDEMIQENQKALDALADSKRLHAKIGKVVLKTGDARDAINATAKELGADLIVMGTHGRRGISRALLGSVAETVVRSAPCPVLTVRPHLEERSGRSAA